MNKTGDGRRKEKAEARKKRETKGKGGNSERQMVHYSTDAMCAKWRDRDGERERDSERERQRELIRESRGERKREWKREGIRRRDIQTGERGRGTNERDRE